MQKSKPHQNGKYVPKQAGDGRKKPARDAFPAPDDDEQPSYEPDASDAVPDEDDYTVKPKSRRQLTERDIERNRRVGELFRRVVPGLPIDTDPPETRQDPETFSVVVEKILKRLNIQESPWLNDLNRAWPTLVPPDVARVARPGKFVDGILFIFVTSSIKLSEIRRTRLRDIERVVRDFPGGDRVRQVRLMINAVPLP